MKVLALYVCLLSFVNIQVCWALPTKNDNEVNGDEDDKDSCTDIFANNGMNYSSFHEGAAHGIHSMSLEEIRYFFKADASDENKIPTVNIDFRSENIIHFNAPLWGYESRFNTWALKIMDWFMLNDQPYFYQNMANTMEKITHQYHMHEIYEKASEIYKELVENPPKDAKDICACATDLTDNGVMSEVVNIARYLKHFGIHRPHGKKGCRGWGLGYSFSYRNKKCKPMHGHDGIEAEAAQSMIENYLANSTKETAEEIIYSSSAWKPGTLVGPKFDNWVPYAAMMTFSLPGDESIRDFAYFMYCMLNHQ